MTPLRELTIAKVHEGLKEKKFSALELVQYFFEHIKEKDPEIGAFLRLYEDSAAKEAEEVDLSLAKNDDLPLLAGIPMAVKDNMLIKGRPATAASKILKDYHASYDSGVVKKLREAQAVIIGSTNLDEFAMGSSTENSAFQKTRNPHDLSRVPGGSSGGSAAAVAGHMAVAALGSDTGGSIRQPAGLCGVVGLKPTYGAVSRSGLIAMSSSLDQIGPLTKTVKDAATVFRAIAGNDPFDATSMDPRAEEYGEELLAPELSKIKELRVGVPKEYFIPGLDKNVEMAVEEALDKVRSLGLKTREISLPHTKYALSTYYIIMPAEVSSNLARFDGVRYSRAAEGGSLKDLYLENRGKGFGEEVKRRIILGTFVLSSGYYDAYYGKAQQVRNMIREDFVKAFEEVQVILTPVTPHVAFKLGERSDPLSMYLEDIFTIPANLAGIPALSLPTGKTHEGLPIGFQLMGRHFREADILGLGQFYERI